jgi:hypothetical protein
VAGTILVISHTHDAHAVTVMERLRQHGAAATLFDTARLPRETPLTIRHDASTGWSASAHYDGEPLDFGGVRSVWWRRPQPFGLHPDVEAPESRGFMLGEAHAAVAGLWSLLDARWLNDPDMDERAGRKAWQLKVARSVGLEIPATCITSDPVAARAFAAARPGKTIYKAFSATETTWRETRVLKEEEASLLDAVRFAPVIFQDYVEALVDLRITVIDGQIFAAEIHSQTTEYIHDFRMAMHQARIAPHALPETVATGLRALMAALGLVYGAIDMRLTPDGRYVFLEINPAGQWLFIEEATKQPITACLVETLVRFAAG